MSEQQIAENMSQGKGIVEKKDFVVVGMNKSDRDHPEIKGYDKPGPGRPARDQNWRIVGASKSDKESSGD